MPNISLPTGKVIYVSVFEFFFKLEDKDVDDFYQSCIADDLGTYMENPWSQRASPGKLEVENEPEIEEAEVDEDYE